MEVDNSSKHCGSISEPWSIISNTNTLNVTIKSNHADGRYNGFIAVWTSIEPPTPIGCDSCTFPLVFANTTFYSCISVQDVDTQPWCSPGPLSPPTEEGTHILPYPKISCSDNDSSCPSSPPQMLVTSQDYPLPYPNNADQVK